MGKIEKLKTKFFEVGEDGYVCGFNEYAKVNSNEKVSGNVLNNLIDEHIMLIQYAEHISKCFNELIEEHNELVDVINKILEKDDSDKER